MVREKIEVIAILVLIYLLSKDASVFGFCHGSAWWTHFSYPLFHASWLHLIGNCYALWFVAKNKLAGRITIPVIYLISVMASFVSESSIPTIGFSGAIYAMAGINISNNITVKSVAIASIALLLGFILPGTNGKIHLASFIGGFFVSSVYNFIQKFNDDYQRIG